MNEWTTMNWLNVFFIFVSGYLAYDCFEEGNDMWGWFNLFASALNFASIAAVLI